MIPFVLDASFSLRWCFESEATPQTEAVLTMLQDADGLAWVPDVWRYEMLNGLGKGVSRGRLRSNAALGLWHELLELPIRFVEFGSGAELLELALRHNLSAYDASYLGLAVSRSLPIASGDTKLLEAARRVGLQVMSP
jgi:predicted nucleic acid-binding protein